MATASLLFTLTPSLINAAIVRAALDYEAALAAYSVARNIMMMLAAFTFMVPNSFLVLVYNDSSYKKFRNSLVAAAAIAVCIGSLVVFTPLKNVILQGLLGLSRPLAAKAGDALTSLLLLPPLTVWRSFSHGVLVRKNKTPYWLWGALAGFIVLFLGLALSGMFSFLPGAIYGAIVLCLSTAADAAVVHGCVRVGAKLSFDDTGGPASSPLRYGQIVRYFLPLFFTTWIMMVCPILINAALARTARPETALAAFAVTNSFIFAFESPVVALRNTALAFRATYDNLRRLHRFCVGIGCLVTLFLCSIAWTPLVHFVLTGLFGVGGEVHEWAVPTIRVMSLTLLVLSWRQFQYAVLMRANKTRIIAQATLARIALLTLGLALGLRHLPSLLPSVVCAAVYMLGFLTETMIAYGFASRLVARARSGLELTPS